jgi:hypothetical protein
LIVSKDRSPFTVWYPKGGSKEADESQRDIAVLVDSSATESREMLKEQQKMLNAL